MPEQGFDGNKKINWLFIKKKTTRETEKKDKANARMCSSIFLIWFGFFFLTLEKYRSCL